MVSSQTLSVGGRLLVCRLVFFIIFLRTRQRRAKAEGDIKSGQERLESTNQSGKAPEVKGPKYKSFLV